MYHPPDPCGWLVHSPSTRFSWDIMGYKIDPLPSYLKLRNFYYSIMLNYIDFLTTPQVQLPRPVLTISSSGLSPASAPPWRIVHKWGGRPPFLLWSLAASVCTPLLGGVPRLLFPPPPRGIPTPRPPHVLLSSPWSVWSPGDGTPPGTLGYPLYTPRSHCRTISPTETPSNTSSQRLVLLILSSSAPSQSSTTAYALYSCSDTPPSN